jgi:hypothetical protein
MAQDDRKTVYDLQSIIERCFEEGKKMGYIKTRDIINAPEAENERLTIVANQFDFVKHIALTIVGELYEFEIIRRISPIFRENKALTMDFLAFGSAFEFFYDKAIQDAQLHGFRIEPQEGGL